VIDPVATIGISIFCCKPADDEAFVIDAAARQLPHHGIVADLFGDDIPCAGQRRFGICHIVVDKTLGQLHWIRPFVLRQQRFCQRLQSHLSGHRRPGAPLGLEWTVDILYLLEGGRCPELGIQVGRELALRFDFRPHGGFSGFQLAEVVQPGLDLAQLLFIKPAGGFLAVAGDKGHGCTIVQQFDSSSDLGWAEFKFGGDGGGEHRDR